MEIVDPHVHHWLPDVHPWYPMLVTAGMGAIAVPYAQAQYRRDSAGHDVAAIVHVSATTAPRAFLDEARWLDDLAAGHGWPAALIGALEPTPTWAEAEPDLDAQAASPWFRGVRVLYGLDPASEFAAGLVRRLADDGLVLDLVAHPRQATGFRALLDDVPELTVVLEHAGWPESTDDFATWRRALDEIAGLPNAYCKISGLAMTLHSVAVDVQRPWIEGCLEAFGPQRCMFASNFPVETLFGTFDELYDTYHAVAAPLPEADQRRLFAGTARAVYRI